MDDYLLGSWLLRVSVGPHRGYEEIGITVKGAEVCLECGVMLRSFNLWAVVILHKVRVGPLPGVGERDGRAVEKGISGALL